MKMRKLSASLEDYLEAILIIGRKKKAVRVKDIATFLHIRAASVVGALQTLGEKGLVRHERYGYVELTPAGADHARKIFQRHEILTRFFYQVLGLDEEIAAEDACKIEHHIHRETIDRLVQFMEFIENFPSEQKADMADFLDFVESGPRPKLRRGSLSE
jgi:DtxR family Mn-dependent transcriptional regulator